MANLETSERVIIGVILAIILGVGIGMVAHSINLKKRNKEAAEQMAIWQQNQQKETDAFNAIPPKEHLALAQKAFKDKEYVEMDKQLSAIDINFPGVKELKKQYEDFIKTRNIADQKKKAEESKNRRRMELAYHKKLSPEIGMDEDTLYECSWGHPYRINDTKTAFGITSQWVYEKGYKMKYVYLRNHIVEAIQD